MGNSLSENEQRVLTLTAIVTLSLMSLCCCIGTLFILKWTNCCKDFDMIRAMMISRLSRGRLTEEQVVSRLSGASLASSTEERDPARQHLESPPDSPKLSTNSIQSNTEHMNNDVSQPISMILSDVYGVLPQTSPREGEWKRDDGLQDINIYKGVKKDERQGNTERTSKIELSSVQSFSSSVPQETEIKSAGKRHSSPSVEQRTLDDMTNNAYGHGGQATSPASQEMGIFARQTRHHPHRGSRGAVSNESRTHGSEAKTKSKGEGHLTPTRSPNHSPTKPPLSPYTASTRPSHPSTISSSSFTTSSALPLSGINPDETEAFSSTQFHVSKKTA